MRSTRDHGGQDYFDMFCAACGAKVRDCRCPECPVCHQSGNPDCFRDHFAAVPVPDVFIERENKP